MAKSRKNKQNMSDKVSHKKVRQEVKNNPFEIRIHKQKHQILGKKISKQAKGLPGVSRSKAIKKRKDTLLKEYQQRNKANRFIDKRFGENDPTLSVEEKMMQRFAFERQRGHGKEAIYQLNEEEELTHYGQSLAEVEKFDETQLASDDEDDDGKLGAKYVSEEHFGGFLTRKKPTNSKEEDSKPKSRQEILDEVIANSKKDKYERKHEKEDMLNLTEKLDEDWREVSRLMAGSKRDKSKAAEVKQKSDDYDIAVRELMFDMKAKATDRMKTAEEVAQGEKERLDKLEKDRQRRMLGLTEDEEGEAGRGAKHQSADDLNDGYALDTVPKTMLSYKDGKPLNPSLFEDERKKKNSESDSDDEDEDAEDGNRGSEGFEDDKEDDDEDDDEDDNHSDLESDDSESDHEGVGENDTPLTMSAVTKEMREEIRRKANEELPYTFKAPNTFEEFLELVGGQSDENRLLIVERIRTCHHPSLAEGNKDKLDTLLAILLRYFGDVLSPQSVQLDFLDGLTRHIYELCQQSAMHAAQCLQSLISEKHQEFAEETERRGRASFPPVATLMYFQLVGLLFPTSDFQHGVVTPTMLFMGQVLSQCPVRKCSDVASALFVCNVFLKYVRLSKRFVPEVINSLRGLLFLASQKEGSGPPDEVIPPFKPVGRYTSLLELRSKSSQVTRKIGVKPQRILETLSQAAPGELDTDEFRCWALSTALGLLSEFAALYAGLSSSREVFAPLRHWLETGRIPTARYPEPIRVLHESLLKQLVSLDDGQRTSLQREKKRPQPLRMFEPKIEEDYDPIRKKKKTAGGEKNEKQRLLHNYKREMKGAIREIRRDAQFLAREKLNEQIEKDLERKEKVKRIHQLLAGQEGDYQATKRGRINLK